MGDKSPKHENAKKPATLAQGEARRQAREEGGEASRHRHLTRRGGRGP